jgi:hypothetical protein
MAKSNLFRSTLFVLGVAASSMFASSNANNPGIVASLDIATVESAKDAYFAYILKQLN